MKKHFARYTPEMVNQITGAPIDTFLEICHTFAATKDNQFSFHYLPKMDAAKNYSHIALFEAMYAGVIKGFMVWGQNPAVSGPNANLERRALEKLDWLVVTDLWHTETANFWRRPGVNPANIKTEVFLLPALASYEKEGSVTNSGRWMQWRYKAAAGPGDSQDDLWMLNSLALKLKELYAKESGPNTEAITKLNWNYGDDHPNVRAVAREINGYDLATGKLVDSFAKLKDDGTTSCGNWVYCGSYTEEGNMAARRDLTPDQFNIGLYPKWAWSWPLNRRIVYNRASVDLNGVPWDREHPVVWWQGDKWVGDANTMIPEYKAFLVNIRQA